MSPKNASIILIFDQIQCTRWLCIKSACQSFQISPHFCPPIPPIRFETSSLPRLSPRPSAAKGTMSFQGDDSHPCFQWKQICAVVTATSTNPPRGTESWVLWYHATWMLISAYVIQAVCLYTVNFFIFVFVTEKVYDGLFDMIMLAWYIMKNKIYIYI